MKDPLYIKNKYKYYLRMPNILYRDNYYYELYSHYITVYKYDIFEQKYIKIDQCLISRLPPKYQDILQYFESHTSSLEYEFKNIKIMA